MISLADKNCQKKSYLFLAESMSSATFVKAFFNFDMFGISF